MSKNKRKNVGQLSVGQDVRVIGREDEMVILSFPSRRKALVQSKVLGESIEVSTREVVPCQRTQT